MRILILALVCMLAISACGKKKEKADIVAELETKPVVTEVKDVKTEEKVKEAAPAITTTTVKQEEAVPAQVVNNAPSPASSDMNTTQGYEMPAQKVTTPTPANQASSYQASQAPAPYPPYQGYQPPPQGNPQQGYAPPPPGYGYGYPPPRKKYVPPGPIETVGEFVGHLVNPFKRSEDESKKEYKGI